MIIILAFIGVFLVPLVIWAMFSQKTANSFSVVVAVWIMQGILFAALYSNISVLGIGAVIHYFAITIVVAVAGAALYPVVFLLTKKPTFWIQKLAAVICVYCGILAIFTLPNIYKGYFEPNTNFYAIVYDRDVKPVPNATITLQGCSGKKKFVADSNGLVNIKAQCDYVISVVEVMNEETKQNCISSWVSDSKEPRTIAEFVAKAGTGNRSAYYWAETYPQNSPFEFQCIWERPKKRLNVENNSDYWRDLNFDGSTYTLNVHEQRKSDRLKEGDFDGQIQFTVLREVIDTSTENYVIHFQSMNGKIQQADKHALNIAPEDGYTTEITHETGKRREILRFYYVDENASQYGYIDFRFRFRPASFEVDSRYFFNLEGERMLDFNLTRQTGNYHTIKRF